MKSCTILVLNSGSTSLKFGFYRVESSLIDDFTQPQFVSETQLNKSVEKEIFDFHILFEGEITFNANAQSQLIVKDAHDSILLSSAIVTTEPADAVLHVLRYLVESATTKPQAIVHRVVHGGPQLLAHCLINDKVMRELELASPYATLHNKASLEIIKTTRVKFPKLPQMVCFDTAMHTNMPAVASHLPLPSHLYALGIKRYGFHGLSCESILLQIKIAAPHLSLKRLIIAHLGGGSSITAIRNGQSVDTTMGLTPSGGVMMGSRCGDVDPGLLIYLMREKNMDCDALEHLINHESGLLGVSGLSNDMRVLRQAASNDSNAQLALDLFCSIVSKQLAAMATVLNGVDAIIFTGGIGQNDAITRANICEKLAFMGVVIDEHSNNLLAEKKAVRVINDDLSSVEVLVMDSNENYCMAKHAFDLIDLHIQS